MTALLLFYWEILILISQLLCRSSPFPHPLASICWFCSVNFCYSDQGEAEHQCALICIFLLSSDSEQF